MVDFLESHFPGALFEATVDERNVASRRLLERIGLEITDRNDSPQRSLRTPDVNPERCVLSLRTLNSADFPLLQALAVRAARG